jgi:hypothetical protein
MEQGRYQTPGPAGEVLHLARTPADDLPYFTLEQPQAAAEYYAANGYVVFRGVASTNSKSDATSAPASVLRSNSPTLTAPLRG